MNNGQLPNAIEAMLFAAAEPLPAKAMCRVLEGTKIEEIKNGLAVLNERYTQIGGSLRVREVAGGYQLYTLPEYSGYIEGLLARTKKQRLSAPALEALAVIAYRQPVSTPEIEKIRGVESGGVLRTLLERNLISIIGRSDRPGRPLLYGTTKEFLYYFGLNHLRELPRIEELEMLLKKREPIGQLSIRLERAADQKDEETPASVAAGAADNVTAEEEDQQETAPDTQTVLPSKTAIAEDVSITAPQVDNTATDTEEAEAETITDAEPQRLVLKRPAEEKTDHPGPEKVQDERTDDGRAPAEEIVEIPAPAEETNGDSEIIRTASEVLTAPVD